MKKRDVDEQEGTYGSAGPLRGPAEVVEQEGTYGSSPLPLPPLAVMR